MFYSKSITLPTLLCYFFINSISINAHDIDYNTTILWSRDISEQNSSYNIEKWKLLKNYINGLETEIITMKRDHYIQNSSLDNISKQLKKMSSVLSNTLTIHYEKHHAVWVYDSIIENINVLKTELSLILKTELASSSVQLEKNKKETNRKALIVSGKFNNFVKVFTPKVRSLENSEKKKQILSAITVINIESSKLSIFSSREFSSQRQMDEYYSNSLRSIKRELQKIQAAILQ